MPKVSPGEKARCVKLNGHVGNKVPHLIIFDQGPTVNFCLLAILHYPLHQRVSPHPSLSAVFELKVCVGYLPAVVLPSYKKLCRHTHVVKKYRIFDTHH